MPARATKKWQVTCSPEQFSALRGQPDFHQLIALARWANAYRFVQASIPKPLRQTPAGNRQKINAILFLSALLYEGWELIKRMNRHYHTYDAWKTGFGPIRKDGRFKQLVQTRLRPLRSQAVFHFFHDEVGQRLAEHEPDGPVVFTSSRGNKSLQAHYEFADLIAIRTLCVDAGPTADALLAQAEDIGEQIAQLGPAFRDAADALITEALQRMGFKEH